MFALCLALLAAAVVLSLIGSVDGSLKIGPFQTPSTCTFKNATGLPCAGCGLTRSWVCLAGGEFRRSLQYHRLGWLVMLYVLTQCVRHGLWLFFPRLRSSMTRFGWWLDRSLIALLVALAINWVFVVQSILSRT